MDLTRSRFKQAHLLKKFKKILAGCLSVKTILLVAIGIFCFYRLSDLSFSQSAGQLKNLYGNYLKGVIRLQNNNFSQALQLLRRTKVQDPGSAHLRIKIASLLAKQGDFKSAEKELEEAKKIDPANSDVSLALMFLYSYQNRDKDLENEYVRMLENSRQTDEDDAKIGQYLGQYYLYKKKYDQAIEVYKNLTVKSADNAEGWFWLGFAYDQAGQTQQAVKAWIQTLKLQPKNSMALNSLGYSYVEQGVNLVEAKKMIESALEIEPDNGAYLDSLGWYYFKIKNYSKAQQFLTKALDLVKDPVIYKHLGALWQALGDEAKAFQYYQQGALEFPNDVDLQTKVKQNGTKN